MLIRPSKVFQQKTGRVLFENLKNTGKVCLEKFKEQKARLKC
jgi:hypothetical protein